MSEEDFQELFSFSFEAEVSRELTRRLLERKAVWDDVFIATLEERAYELRPDLAVWQLLVDGQGELQEHRFSLVQ